MKEQEDKSQSTIDLQPKKVNLRHRALMRRLVSGMRLESACLDLGMSVTRASLVVNSPLFQEEMKRMTEGVDREFIEAETGKIVDETRRVLTDASSKAAKTLEAVLDDENVTARVSAAKDILDRTGYAKEDKIKARVLVEPSQSLLDVISRITKEKSGD